MLGHPTPILRSFDEKRTKDFYLGFLGFELVFEHRFEEWAPLYMSVKKGDCVLHLPGLDWATGPVSTITGATIINMIRCATAEALLRRGIVPTLLPSHQYVGNSKAYEQLEAFYEGYRKSLAHLFE